MNAQELSAGPRPGGTRSPNPRLRRRQNAIAAASAAVAEQLNEPNVPGIARLIEIFGEDLVRQIAATAIARFEAAQALGPEAYKPQPYGSAVATHTGEPRGCGGVFFYLMREHARTTGLDWFGLRIPSPPRSPANAIPTSSTESKLNQPVQTVPEAATAPKIPEPSVRSISITAPATAPVTAVPDREKVPEASTDAAAASVAKPNRIKATVVGTPSGEPKPTDQPGVLQLVFEVEMTPTMPKGLPTLGRSRVIVLCTEKQYRQALPGGSPTGRMIVDGEIATTLSTPGKPLLVLVCTRLTTTEAEQAKHSNQH